MREYDFMQIDAFTDTALCGNPCAVVFDADGIDEAGMQGIAREMNLSETAYVLRSDVADVRARYFTPTVEIPLAGHPTIATIFGLVETGRLALTGDVTTVSLELQVGPVQVDIKSSAGVAREIVMSQKRPEFLRTYDAGEVLPIFGLSPEDVLPDVPVQAVSTGTAQLMIPLRSMAAVRKVQIDVARYVELVASGDFFSAHVFCLDGATPAGDTFARHFAPPAIPEDSFTGSATGGMGAYLWRYDLLDTPVFVAEQGHDMGRPGQAAVEVVGPQDAIETVKVGGSAVTIVRGTLRL